MTDHDRGAYTPNGDAPLAFDARGPRERGPAPMTLIASAVVLLVILGALFLAYKGGVRGSADAARPVGEPVGAIKTAAPATAAQPADPAARLDVYAAQNVPNARPTFAPAPEQPAPRPAPSAASLHVKSVDAPPVRIETDAPAAKTAATTTTTTATKTAAASPARTTTASAPIASAPVASSAPASGAPVSVAPGSGVSASGAPASVATARTSIHAGAADAASRARPIQTAALTAPAALGKAAPAAPATGTAASTAGPTVGAAVQIGAFSSRPLADKGYADVSSLMGGSMSGKRQHVEAVARDGKTMFRTTIGGFSDRAGAKAFCDALQAKGRTCFVKGA